MARDVPSLKRWSPAQRLAALLVLATMFLAVRHLSRLHPALQPTPSLYRLDGFLRYELGDYAGAAAAYRRDACRVWTSDARQGDLVCGESKRARMRANARMKTDPHATEPLLTLGEIALDKGRPAEALRWFQRALSKGPNDLDAQLLASLAYAQTGQIDAAMYWINRVLRDGAARRPLVLPRLLAETGRQYALPSGTRSPCWLAHLHRYLRIYDPSQERPAAASAEQAIAAGDHADAAWLTLGILHQKRAEDEEALAAFQHAIEVNSDNAEAYRWAAMVYGDRGDLENQYRMTRAAYEHAPDDPAYIVLYGRLLETRLGDYRSALELEGKAHPNDTAASLNHRARLHVLLDEPDEALALYRRAAAMAPRDPDHLRGEAAAFMVLGRDDYAITALERALDLDMRRNETRYRLGLLYRNMGRYDQAAPLLEPVLLSDPALGDHRPDLCTIYFLTADFDRARWCAGEFIAWSPDGRFMRSFDLESALEENG